MKLLPSLLLASLISSAAAFAAADSATSAPAPEQDKALAPFAREMKGDYPGHVAGCTVAKGHVTKAAVSKYCMMRTSLCGEGARCGHPGARVSAVFDIAVDGVLATNVKDGAKPPADFKNWRSFKDAGLKEGDAVLFSFYSYNNGVPPAIATLVKAPPAAPAATPAPAAAAEVAYWLGEGYFVKNTHPIPAGGGDCLWLATQDAFDAVFQKTPPLMGGVRMAPVNLADSVALAVIYQGRSVPEMMVTSVAVKDGGVEIAYKLVKPADGSAVFAVPLIVVIEKAALEKAGGAKSVRFIENGKPIGTAAAPEK